MKKLLFVISLLFLAATACKKAGDRSCFKSSGEKTSVVLPLPEFDRLHLNKRLKYVLVQDDSCYLRITGGKNLLGFIRWEETETGKITITNHNKCNFLRDLSAICTVEIHFKTLSDLAYEGSEALTNQDTLQLNAFNLLIINCAGSVDLTLNANYISADIAESYGDYTFRGTVQDASLSARSNGYCNTEGLTTSNKLYVVNKSSGDMHINASNCYLEGYIGGNGNIYYKGSPISSEMEYFSSGKLIPY
ncbi:MAG: GIN domain-containing protein [Bacteroidota bacterium]